MRSGPPCEPAAVAGAGAVLRAGLRYARVDRILLFAVVAGTVGVAAQLSLPWAVGRIIDEALGADDAAALIRWSLFLVGAALAFVVAKGCSDLAFTRWRENAMLVLTRQMLTKLHQLPVAELDRVPTGELHARFVNDATRAGNLYSPVVRQIMHSVIQLCLATAVLSVQYGRLALWAVAVIPAYLLCPLIFGRTVRRASADLQRAEGDYSARLQEIIGGAREIRAFGRGTWSVRQIEPALRAALRGRVRVQLHQWGYNFQFALYWGILAVAYWIGGRQVLSGDITIGQLVAFVAYLGALSSPLDGLVSAHGQIQAAHGALERVVTFLETPAERDTGSVTHALRRPPAVEFRDVSFAYPGRTRNAVTRFDLRVEPGERIAIVGLSGSGKSTLLKLLLRFHDPQTGSIRVDGVDLRDLRLSTLRDGIGLLSQEPTMFSGTIRENIRFGRLDASDAEIEAAAQLSQADDFIRELPNAYQAEMGERGLSVSVGQRQRIALARVLTREPVLLLLDEPTSNLDALSEQAIQQGLDRVLGGCTSFLVAHRLSTAMAADRILVMNEGRLVASGTHAELLRASRLYRKLHETSLAGLDGSRGPPPTQVTARYARVAAG